MRAALCFLLAMSSAGRADDRVAAAKAESRAADELAAAQNYKGAAAKFRAAFRLDPLPGYVCNVGVAYQRAKDLPHAHIYLTECLRVGRSALDASFLGLVRKALDEVEATLHNQDFARVDVGVTPQDATLTISSFESDEQFVGPHVIWLPFGTHTIDVRASGHAPAKQSIVVRTRDPQTVSIALARQPASAEPTAGGAQPGDGAAPPPTPGASVRPSKVPALVATGATVALAGVAVTAFVKARSIADTAGSPDIDRDEYNRRVDRTRNWQHASWAFAGLAGAGAVVSAYLWVRASRTPSVEVTPSATGASVSFAGRW